MTFARIDSYPESLRMPCVRDLLTPRTWSSRKAKRYNLAHRRKLSPCYQVQMVASQTSTVLLPASTPFGEHDESVPTSSKSHYLVHYRFGNLQGLVDFSNKSWYRIKGSAIHEDVSSWLTRVFKPRTNSTAACTTGLGGPSVFPSPDSITNFTIASTFSITLSLSNACSRTGPPFAKPN